MTDRPRTLKRRTVLGSLALGGLALGLPGGWARAMGASSRRKFVFVFAKGGWDPTRVFVPVFGNDNIDTESSAVTAEAGGLSYVDHGDRPSVRAFFEANHASCLVLNGVYVRSLAHEVCTRRLFTGGLRSDAAGWPTLLAEARAADYVLPHVNLSGPAFPGTLGSVFASLGRNGQLDRIVDGSLLQVSEQPVELDGSVVPGPAEEALADEFLKRRLGRRYREASPGREAELVDKLERSFDRTVQLKVEQPELRTDAGGGLRADLSSAVRVLAAGLSRCVTVGHLQPWDTHTDNDAVQSRLFEELFAGLTGLASDLASTNGPDGAPLSEETVVVVFSEMGRTPKRNSVFGKDHWPYTSVLMMGPGLTGGRVVGGVDGLYYGLGVDPRSGETGEGLPLLGADVLGATLLTLADVDPGRILPEAEPLRAVLT